MTDDVEHLPVRALPPSRHPLGEPISVPANGLLGRHAQTERTCKNCGAVKVTVHPPGGGGWREWRLSATGLQCRRPEPECEVISSAAGGP